MRMPSLCLAALLAAVSQSSAANDTIPANGESVVVLHGLARSSDSMSRMARSLELAGYHVCNVSYPSRKHSVEVLTKEFVAPSIRECLPGKSEPVHFVTHSLGGIIVRQLAVSEADLTIGRVVMLSPPNHGSEVVDKLGGLTLFKWLNGPAGSQLGTDAASLPRTLGSVSFDVGVITGNRSINLILSSLIPGTDDGKVSIESARLDGMADFCVVPSSHPFIMRNEQAIEQTLSFLSEGKFKCEARKIAAAGAD